MLDRVLNFFRSKKSQPKQARPVISSTRRKGKMLFKKPAPAPVAQPAQRKAAAASENAVPVVNVGQNPSNGNRVLSIEIPQFKSYTDAERRAIEREKGSEAIGQCDVTGELIFKKKNATELRNGERPEFDGVVISTGFLNSLFGALGNPNTKVAKATKKSK